MSTRLDQFWGRARQVLLVVLIQLVLLQPVMVAFPSQAQADTTPDTPHNDQSCYDYVNFLFRPDAAKPASVQANTPSADDPEALGDSELLQSINLTDVKENDQVPDSVRKAITSTAYINSVLDYYGNHGMTYYQMPSNATAAQPGTEWLFVCSSASQTIEPDLFSPFASLSPLALEVLNTLADPSPKLIFKNPRDLFAVLGERCGTPLDAQRMKAKEDPCTNFQPEDDYFPNGVWDAPKVSDRVVATLAYLITPVERGGAGREYIRVKEVVRYDKTDPAAPPVVENQTNAQNNADLGQSQDATPDPSGAPDASAASWIDPADPPAHPKNISTSLIIDQIDKVRVASKIVEKRLFGNNTVSYKYQAPFPVDVAWQTDSGFANNQPPDFSNLSMLQSTRFLTNAAIVQMLNQFGLGDLSIDTSSADINDFGDVALLIGESLLEQLMGSPNGSLRGWDLASNLKSIGLAYLEQQLGLVPGALADRNPLDNFKEGGDFSDIAGSIGRATVEYVLGFPRGSLYPLKGTSTDLLENVGRRYLEQEVFKVTWGTLTPDATHPLKNIGDLLARLGEGRIEQVFKLPRQSLRKENYKDFRQSSYKATLLFPSNPTPGALTDDQYLMSDYVSNQLNLAYNPYTYQPTDAQGNSTGSPVTAGSDMYGFHEGDFNMPSLTVAPGDIEKFKEIVGSSTIQSGIGMFHSSGITDRLATEFNGTPPKTIDDGKNLNFQLRPLSHDYVGLQRNWCEETEFKKDYLADPSNPDDIRKAMDRIRKDGFKLQDSYGQSIKVDCADAGQTVSQSFDVGLVSQVQEMLFTKDAVSRTTVIDTGKEPQVTEITNHLQHNNPELIRALYNTMLLLYYNLPENQFTHTVNTIDLGSHSTGTVSNPDGSTQNVPTGSQLTLSQALDAMINGTNGFSPDPDLGRRVSLMQDLLNKNKQDDIFNLDKIKDLPTQELSNALIDRINILTVHPSTKNFAAEYNQAEFNGWNFLLSDLQRRMDCKVKNGIYTLVSSGTAYDCTPLVGGQSPDKSTTTLASGASTLVGRLMDAPRSLGNALMDSLNSGTVQDPNNYAGNQNQSAQSVAIGMPSQGYKVDEYGRLQKDHPEFNGDVMRLLLSPVRNGDGTVPHSASIEPFFTRSSTDPQHPDQKVDHMSSLGQIGKQYAARKFLTDTLAQRTFAAQLKTDFSDVTEDFDQSKTVFDEAVDQSKSYGVDQSLLEDKGLADGDFQRIFMLNDGISVFERVGKEELLRTVWQRTGAAAKIKSSQQYAGILNDLKLVSQKLEFYTSRFQQIQNKVDDLNDKLSRLDGDDGFKTARANLRALQTKMKGKSTDNIKYVQALVRAYEPVLAALRNKANQENLADITQEIAEIMHLAEEVISGKALPRQQFGDIDPNKGLAASFGDKKANDPCFLKSDLLNLFSGKGDIFKNALDTALQVGGCTIDTGFSLPKGSMYTWYQLGLHKFVPLDVTYDFDILPDGSLDVFPIDIKEVGESNKQFFKEVTVDGVTKYKPIVPVWNANNWNLDNFQVAVGIADQEQRGATVNLDKLVQQSPEQINSYSKNGKQILELTMAVKAVQLVPGVGGFMKKYAISVADLVQVFQGNTLPLAARVGGTIIDQALNLPAGTSAQLISPTCYDNTGARAPCDRKAGQAGRDPDNMRMQTLAELGLRQLGLTVPDFPTYFSFTSGGNLLENWGNASISQALGLAPNSFKGKISDDMSTTDKSTPAQCALLPLRCKNTISTLMNAFGMSQTPEVRNLLTIEAQMLTVSNDASITTADKTAFHIQLDSLVYTLMEQITFARLYGADWKDKGWWGDPKNEASLMTADYDLYTSSLMPQLWKMPQEFVSTVTHTRILDGDTVRKMRLAMVDNQGMLTSSMKFDGMADTDSFPANLLTDDAQTIGQLNTMYKSYITYFQSKLDRLNSQYKLVKDDKNPDKDNSFNGFLKGNFAASKIATTSGMADTVNEILGNRMDKWIDDQGPDWLKQANDAFKLITADKDICNKEEGFGHMLASLITSTTSTCSFAGLKGTSMNEMLFSTAGNYVQLRQLLFDKYLSKIFTGDLERSIGFQQGTFRALASDPKRGDQLLISEGSRIIADRVFGKAHNTQSCQLKAIPDADCAAATIENSLHDAFMAGFYDPQTKRYTLNFSVKRSTAAFNVLMNKALDQQLARIGREYIGVEITRADFNLLLAGDSRFFALIALQYTANQLNRQLLKGPAGRSPLAGSFLIRYADVRSAAGLPSAATVKQDEQTAQWQFLVENGCLLTEAGYANTGCFFVSMAQLQQSYMQELKDARLSGLKGILDNDGTINGIPYSDEYFEYQDIDTNGDGKITAEEIAANAKISADKDPVIKERAAKNVEEAGKTGAKDILREQRNNAQRAVMYGMLDIIAFTKDQNIPVGFSRRILGKSASGRIDAMAEYAFNSLLSSDSTLGKALQGICGGEANRGQCYQFFKDLANAIGSGKDMPSKLQSIFKNNEAFINRLDGVFAQYFKDQFDIKLPDGVFKGIYVWAMDGFKKGDFNKDSLCFGSTKENCAGGFSGVPVGRILENWGIETIASWGDRQFGFQAGTTFKFIQAIQLISTIQRLRATGNNLREFLNVTEFDPTVSDEEWYSAQDDLTKSDKLLNAAEAELAQLAGEIVSNLFKSQLADADQSLGLPQGTTQTIVSAGVTYGVASLFPGGPAKILGGGFWVGVGIQLGLILVFGVVNVEVTTRATGDGYYPFYDHGHGGGSTPPYVEQDPQDHTDPFTGTFDPTGSAYHQGLMTVARTKVTGLLMDLLRMPTSRWATEHGFPGTDLSKTLWISQVFTYGSTDFNPRLNSLLTDLYNKDAPKSVDPKANGITSGYSQPTFSCDSVTTDSGTGQNLCNRNKNHFEGFFPRPDLVDAIYIRW